MIMIIIKEFYIKIWNLIEALFYLVNGNISIILWSVFWTERWPGTIALTVEWTKDGESMQEYFNLTLNVNSYTTILPQPSFKAS